MRRRVALTGAAVVAGGSAAVLWSYVQFCAAAFDPLQGHRPFNRVDLTALRDMRGRSVPAERNPGVRVTPDFCTPAEEAALAAEVLPLIQAQGADMVPARFRPLYQRQMSHIPRAPEVNVVRLTGRFEGQPAGAAPWGYGDTFDEAALPPTVRTIARRIQSHPGFDLGPLRDVTVNCRHGAYFRLDPHLDPPGDGENVFILGLLSDTVLTFSPVGHPQQTEQTTIGERSWTREDIDCVSRRRGLLHFCGPARHAWYHGTRQGVATPASQPTLWDRLWGRDPSANAPPLMDWFGTPDAIVPRGTQRVSLVFAFRHPTPQLFPSSWLGGNQY
eukprot:EG_transcript_14167